MICSIRFLASTDLMQLVGNDIISSFSIPHFSLLFVSLQNKTIKL